MFFLFPAVCINPCFPQEAGEIPLIGEMARRAKRVAAAAERGWIARRMSARRIED